jgi:hypothetical protein
MEKIWCYSFLEINLGGPGSTADSRCRRVAERINSYGSQVVSSSVLLWEGHRLSAHSPADANKRIVVLLFSLWSFMHLLMSCL